MTPHIEAIGGITELDPDKVIERISPALEYREVLTLALQVLLAKAEDLHCSSDQPIGCSHQTARNLINVLAFPSLIVRAKS